LLWASQAKNWSLSTATAWKTLRNFSINAITLITEFIICILLGLFRCSERKYDKENFDSNVAEMPFDDHNAPPFELIYDFCLDAVRMKMILGELA
jgi:hypothetical protein